MEKNCLIIGTDISEPDWIILHLLHPETNYEFYFPIHLRRLNDIMDYRVEDQVTLRFYNGYQLVLTKLEIHELLSEHDNQVEPNTDQDIMNIILGNY